MSAEIKHEFAILRYLAKRSADPYILAYQLNVPETQMRDALLALEAAGTASRMRSHIYGKFWQLTRAGRHRLDELCKQREKANAGLSVATGARIDVMHRPDYRSQPVAPARAGAMAFKSKPSWYAGAAR